MPVMIGVDPHKASHTAAALDEHGRLLGPAAGRRRLQARQALSCCSGYPMTVVKEP